MKILFLGNSYTHGNALPKMIEVLAASKGIAIDTTMIAPGGKTLEWHTQNPDSTAALADNSWDYVALQEQSLRPILDPEAMLTAAMKLGALIDKAGAQAVLYNTWPRKHKPKKLAAITDAYTKAATMLNGKLAPVGQTRARILDQDPKLEFYTEDRHHPSLLGSYVSACVVFAVVTGESPVGLPSDIAFTHIAPQSVDSDAARLIQDSAWAVYSNLPEEFK